MRTTIRLDDDLLARAKRTAAERGTTLTALIEDALRRALAQGPASHPDRPPLPTFRGDGLQPGVDLDDTAALLDVMDGRHARS
ncbi:MAG TPA: CopG family transcriptional regulator [Gaiellaceae bacterium]|nr:CopG family transcriptional regulator [Gaiellaceae bacterium]